MKRKQKIANRMKRFQEEEKVRQEKKENYLEKEYVRTTAGSNSTSASESQKRSRSQLKEAFKHVVFKFDKTRDLEFLHD